MYFVSTQYTLGMYLVSTRYVWYPILHTYQVSTRDAPSNVHNIYTMLKKTAVIISDYCEYHYTEMLFCINLRELNF